MNLESGKKSGGTISQVDSINSLVKTRKTLI